jgi:hypothetical protein
MSVYLKKEKKELMLMNYGEFSHLKNMISTHTKDFCEETDPTLLPSFYKKFLQIARI